MELKAAIKTVMAVVLFTVTVGAEEVFHFGV
jgi:hypothetical protein